MHTIFPGGIWLIKKMMLEGNGTGDTARWTESSLGA